MDIKGEVNKHTDAQLIQVILNGHGTMPAIDVTEEEAQAILDYLRNVLFAE